MIAHMTRMDCCSKAFQRLRTALDGATFIESLALYHDNDNAIVHHKIVAMERYISPETSHQNTPILRPIFV
jgi:hypothetical protein